MRNVTLKDIAQEAGTTIPTVSAALNNTGRIGEAKRQYIRKIAKKMGYHPNLAAQLLKSKRVFDIGFVINEKIDCVLGSGLFEPMIMSFIQECKKESIKYQLEFCDFSAEDSKLPRLMTGGVVGGILYAGHIPEKVVEWQKSSKSLPFFSIEEKSAYCAIDDGSGMTQAVQYLAALGHRRLLFVGGDKQYHLHSINASTFIKASQEYALNCDESNVVGLPLEADSSVTIAVARNYFEDLFRKDEYPTAIICTDVRVARAAIFSALNCGIKVPEDCSIISMGASWETAGSCPPITSIERDSERLVAEGISVLRRIIAGNKVSPVNIEMPAKLIVRGSTAKNRFL